MVGQLKEDVAEWYQGLSAHRRIEAMCTLIDLSMPFEIRFLGSLIEHLGRKDFPSLRDAESKANSFTHANPEDKKKLLSSLAEVTTGCMVNGTQYANPLMHPNNFNDSPGNRPSPTHNSDPKGRHLSISDQATTQGPEQQLNDQESSANSHDTFLHSKGNVGKVGNSTSNHIGGSSEDETESVCVTNDHKRRKLILYISVLQPTNHDGANLYYSILSDIEDSPALAWLEDLDKDAQEEVSLLYTLASRHPAFTIAQRMFLSTVANRVNEIITLKYPSRGNSATPLQAAQVHSNSANPGGHPVFINHTPVPQTMDQKYAATTGYYFIASPHATMHMAPHQSMSNNGEQIRSTAVSGPFPSYPPFGSYILTHPHHHHAALPHPTALNPHYAQNIMGSPMQIPTASSVMTTPTGPNPHQAVAGTPVPASSAAISNSSHQLSSKAPAQSQPPPHIISSVSQQSCLSTPTRTSSVPFQSEANSENGDSEESSENCDWNSPESSPFESPPQSLTPSRSQSPPSGVPNSTTVQAVSHSSTFLVTSTGSAMSHGSGAGVPHGNNTQASTIVKTEYHSSSGFVITTTTSSSTSTSTASSNCSSSGGGSALTPHSVSSTANNGVSNSLASKSSSTGTLHHQQSHHPQPSSSSSTIVRNQLKNSSTAGNGNNTNLSFSIHPPPLPTSVGNSAVISVSQQPSLPPPPQMMGPSVPGHLQQQSSVLTSVNNVGVVSHSMSSANAPPMAYAPQNPHGAHNNIGLNSNLPPPQQQTSYPCFPHMNTAASFGGMNASAAYRAPSQGVLTRNPYVQAHANQPSNNAMMNNQMAIKPDVQRGVHNVHPLRQKTPLQNTPKRRNNVGAGSLGNIGNPGIAIGGPPHVNSQSTSCSSGGKGDEVSESPKDVSNRTNEIVVSANQSNNKGAQSQQERTSVGGKSYHHVSNGIVNNSVGGGAVLPGNNLPNSNSVAMNNIPPQAAVGMNSSSNPGAHLMQSGIVGGKGGEDGLLGDGGAVLDNYPSTVNQIPYHINGPLYGHPSGHYIPIPNGYVTSSYYHNPAAMAAAAAAAMGAGGPGHVPQSTEIMMTPTGVPHCFPVQYTIPQGFSSPQPQNSVAGKGINNSKDSSSKQSNSGILGNGSGTGGNGTDSSNKTANQHDPHGGGVIPHSYPLGHAYYATLPARTPAQPSRNNRGFDFGGALGNSSLSSPVEIVMPPLEEPVETVNRPRKLSCYNCGANNHLGPDCKEGSMEEMTRHQFRVNYSGPSSVTAEGKDGD